MPRFSRLETLNRILEVGLVPVFYHGDVAVTCQVVEACAAAGGTVFEFTNRGDHAVEVFSAVEKYCRKSLPQVVLGVGSIVEESTAALFVAAGASFVVSPSFNERVARFCNRRKVPYLPGCMTVTEIGVAEEAGVEIVKMFPCEAAGGPGFVKAVLGPSPWTRILPTGIEDATPAAIHEWFKAGACALGLGRTLIDKKTVDSGDYPAVSRRVAEVLAWVRQARKA